MRGRVSTKGQVTIPIAVRRALGLRAGVRVEFALCDGGAMLRKRLSRDHPGDAWVGAVTLPAGLTVDRLIEELRGPGPGRRSRRRSGASAGASAGG